MRRFVIMAIAVAGLLAFGATAASAAANFKSQRRGRHVAKAGHVERTDELGLAGLEVMSWY
jgi:hypothetical protein